MKSLKELIFDEENFISNSYKIKDEKNNITHELSKIGDDYVHEVYLILLLSVIETLGEIDETQENPLIYVYNNVVAMEQKVDMKELFRRSVLIDNKSMEEYSKTLCLHGLQNIFLYDALTIKYLYAKSIVKTEEYIFSLAELLGIGNTGVMEISGIVRSVTDKSLNFTYKFQEIEPRVFLPYLRMNCKNIYIQSSDLFFADYENKMDMTSSLPSLINHKKKIWLHNVYIHDSAKKFSLSDNENVVINQCQFERMQYEGSDVLLEFKNNISVKLIECEFRDIYKKGDFSYFEAACDESVMESGIIAKIVNSNAYFDNIMFENCYYLPKRDEGTRMYGPCGYMGWTVVHTTSLTEGALLKIDDKSEFESKNCKGMMACPFFASYSFNR